jgi:comEA protein
MIPSLPLVFHVRRLAALWLVAILFNAGASHATKKPPLQPININAATSEELQQVPGIGPATADKILQMRKSYGPFKSVDDLLAIRGLGKKRLDKMRKYLVAGKPASAKPPGRSSSQATKCPGCTKNAPPSKQATLTIPPKTSAKPADKPEAETPVDEDEEPE